MKSKQIIYLGLVVLGAALLFFSNHIMNEVGEGRGKIERAQKAVDQGNSLFSLNPVSKEIGKGLTGSIQKKIDAGSEEAAFYEKMANFLWIGGIVLCAGGAGFFIYEKYKTRSPR